MWRKSVNNREVLEFALALSQRNLCGVTFTISDIGSSAVTDTSHSYSLSANGDNCKFYYRIGLPAVSNTLFRCYEEMSTDECTFN